MSESEDPPKQDEPVEEPVEESEEESVEDPEEEAADDSIDDPAIDEPEASEPGLDDVDVRDLLRDALAPPTEPERKITRGVQKRIRERTKGRYFGDGWSTADAPGTTFLVTTALMLAVVLLVWLFLTPWGVEILK